jgi:hypothetical protein
MEGAMMMVSAPIMSLVCICLVANSAIYADDRDEDYRVVYKTGDTLAQNCRNFLQYRRQGSYETAQDGYDGALCYGFVVGVLDTVSWERLSKISDQNFQFCLPTNTNAGSLTEVVATFLDENAALRSRPAYVLVMQALVHSFPCAK